MELMLDSFVQYIPRVGPVMAQKLGRLGIRTVADLLFYAPFRYNDYSRIAKIRSLRPGETVTVEATVRSIKNAFTKTGKKLQQAKVADDTGELAVLWFNQMYLTNIIKPGDILRLSGKADWFGHTVVMTSPDYEKKVPGAGLHTGRLVPVYPETAGVSSKWLRGRIGFILEQCKDKVLEYIPDSIQSKFSLIPIKTAIEDIHYPKNIQDSQKARFRLGFDELLILLLSARLQRRDWEKLNTAVPIKTQEKSVQQFVQALPFELTRDQKTAVNQIAADLKRKIPMNRLLLGDVGSGKTVVAAAAIYAVWSAGFGSVLMAPTQILSHQHFQTLSQAFADFHIPVTLVTGSTQRKATTRDTAPSVLVGTHALLSENVDLADTGLIVIDEQQRFGVGQRSLLRRKAKTSTTPHLLTMTATPIPRTIAQTIYSNLDLTVIAEMPKGRQKIKTWVVPPHKREAAYTWMATQMKDTKSQAFIVCPLIEDSETSTTVKAATSEYQRLGKDVFPHMKLGLLHGRLKQTEKEKIITAFTRGTIDILVTTPVVEVGIDIPNAHIMLIEAADRFGLAQLHQLRGRVGRSSSASYCLLFTEAENEESRQRLKLLETIHNGPELAQRDLTLRGPGDILGTRQHGLPDLKIAKLTDPVLLGAAVAAADELVRTDPALSAFPLLREILKKHTIDMHAE